MEIPFAILLEKLQAVFLHKISALHWMQSYLENEDCIRNEFIYKYYGALCDLYNKRNCATKGALCKIHIRRTRVKIIIAT